MKFVIPEGNTSIIAKDNKKSKWKLTKTVYGSSFFIAEKCRKVPLKSETSGMSLCRHETKKAVKVHKGTFLSNLEEVRTVIAPLSKIYNVIDNMEIEEITVEDAPLGNFTFLASTQYHWASPEDANIVLHHHGGGKYAFTDMVLSNKQQRRRKRYKLLHSIQRWLKSTVERQKMYKRLAACGLLPGVVRDDSGRLRSKDIKVVKSHAHGSASYSGVGVCGNVWGCPVCSEKIKARRGAEIKQGVGMWLSGYGSEKHYIIMLTLTHPHSKGDRLADNIARHNKARRRLASGRWWQSLKSDAGIVGTITGSEVTYGMGNGWHWHQHILIFCDGDPAVWENRREEIIDQWIHCCRLAGFDIDEQTEADMRKYSVDLMLNCHATDYLTKMDMGSWGVDREISGGEAKKAHGDRYTPFELAEAGKWNLFEEYLAAVKGIRQLRWSAGLKKLLGVEEKTDEQLVDEAQDDAEVLAVVPLETWRKITARQLQCKLLEVSEFGGAEALFAWADVEGLQLRRPVPCNASGGRGGGDSPPSLSLPQKNCSLTTKNFFER